MRTLLSGRSRQGCVFTGQFEPSNPFIASIEGEGDPGGGGTPPSPPPTFTQAELNRIAAKEKAEGERAATARLNAEYAAREEALNKRIAELELAGKTEEQKRDIERKQREEADAKARKAREDALTQERDAKAQEAQTFRQKWLEDRKGVQIGAALIASNALGSASEQAARIFAMDAKIETDDEGHITSVIYAGQSYTKVTEATAAFLKSNPHFAAATSPNGGSGARSGNGTVAPPNGKQLHELSTEELLALDAQKQRAATQ